MVCPAFLAVRFQRWRLDTDSIASWAFRFANSLPGVQVVLSGMPQFDQAADNVRPFSDPSPLSDEEKRLLDKVFSTMVDLVPCTAPKPKARPLHCLRGMRQNLSPGHRNPRDDKGLDPGDCQQAGQNAAPARPARGGLGAVTYSCAGGGRSRLIARRTSACATPKITELSLPSETS